MNSYVIDLQRWSKMNIFEQMGNICSEVGRALAAKQRGDHDACELATARAVNLFDATTYVLVAQHSIRTKEVLRAKDQFLQLIYGRQPRDEDIQALDNYFLHYAVAARRNR